MISQCELSQDVSGASFPQFILQTLIEKQKDGQEEPDQTDLTEQQQRMHDGHLNRPEQSDMRKQSSNNTSQTTLLLFNSSFSQKSQTFKQGVLNAQSSSKKPQVSEDMTA